MAALKINREFPAPPERVWRALTEPADLTAWFWPERFATEATVEPRRGGRYRIAGPGAGMAVGGEFTSVQQPDHLGFTWQWDGETETTEVSIDLAQTGGSTTLVLNHAGFATDAARDEHIIGWNDCFDRLSGYLS